MIKVGKYTAALLLVVVGSLLLIDLTTNTELTGKITNWWPVVIILLGIEYLFISVIYRSPDRKIGFAIGSLILSIVLSIAVIGYTTFPNMSFLSSINIGSVSFSNEKGKAFDKAIVRVPVNDKHDKVYIHNLNGQIEIIAGDVDQIEIATTIYVNKLSDEEANDVANDSNVIFEDNGSSLKIEAKGKEYRVFGIKQKPRMNMVITVPMDKALDYDLDMTNGKLVASDIKIKDIFIVDTTNGSIHVSNIVGDVLAESTNGNIQVEQIVGDVDLETTNGSITTNNVDGDVISETTNGKIIGSNLSGKLDVETTNGSITLTEVLHDVEAATTNGSITVHTSSIGGDWELDTTNGKVELFVPEQSDFEVDGSGARDGIQSDFRLKISKGNVRGIVGNGEHEIKIDTNSGIGIYKNS